MFSAPPIRPAQAAGEAIFFPTGVVGEIHPLATGVLLGVGIKVIVHEDAIHVVAAHHVEHDGLDAGLGSGFAGVEQRLVAVMPDQLRQQAGDVIGGGGGFGLGMAGAEGVEPGVQGESALVRLGDGKRERIIVWRGGAALDAGEVFGPRLDGGGIHGVADGAHLEKNGVEMELGGAVQQGDELRLLLGDGQAGLGRPVFVGHGGDPGGPEFADRRRGHGRRIDGLMD